MHILEDLWHGDLDIGKWYPSGRQYANALRVSDDCEAELNGELSGKAKELFSGYVNTQLDLRKFSDCESFIAGFRLGAQLMLDILSPGTMKDL